MAHASRGIFARINTMDVHFYLGIFAGLISATAYIVYFVSILKGNSKPSRVTWWIWTFMGAILAASNALTSVEGSSDVADWAAIFGEGGNGGVAIPRATPTPIIDPSGPWASN
ncbi:MAG: hypothetical protein JWN49_327 [Parcubacteria group bacterium]|nr:hypothetical protein [Parcubacteria group bacterium]